MDGHRLQDFVEHDPHALEPYASRRYLLDQMGLAQVAPIQSMLTFLV